MAGPFAVQLKSPLHCAERRNAKNKGSRKNKRTIFISGLFALQIWNTQTNRAKQSENSLRVQLCGISKAITFTNSISETVQENRRNYFLLHFIVFIWGWTAILG